MRCKVTIRRGLTLAGVAAIGFLLGCEPGPNVPVLDVTTMADGVDALPGDGVCEVTSGAGDCSLRAAIDEANATPAGSLIVNVPSGEYVLGLAGSDDANAAGDLDLNRTGATVISAPSGGAFRIDAAGADRVLDVHGGNVALIGSGLRGAASDGVRVRAGATVNLAFVASTQHGGAGLVVDAGGKAGLANSTVSSNGGAGVDVDGEVTGRFVTVTANGGSGLVGSGEVALRSSVVADQAGGDDCDGPDVVSGGYNLDSDSTCGLTATGDVSGEGAMLAPLDDGTVPAHRPDPGSPLVDAVPEGAASCGGAPAFDQQGTPRPRGDGCERGAIELTPTLDLVVDTAADGSDAVPGDDACEVTPGAGDCTLRAAIDEVNASPLGTGHTITLAADPVLTVDAAGDEDANAEGDLDLHVDVTIEGAGHTIDGGTPIERVIDHRAGELTIHDATITGGDNFEERLGGGLWTQSTVLLDHVTVTENSSAGSYFVLFATDASGIMAATGSDVTVRDSAIIDNRSRGAKLNEEAVDGVVAEGTMTIERSTIARNGPEADANGSVDSSRSALKASGTGRIHVVDSTISGQGRGITVGPDAEAVVERSTIDSGYWAGSFRGSQGRAREAAARVDGTLEVRSSTIGGGGFAIDATPSATVEVAGSALVSGNGVMCRGPVTSGGWNLEPTGTCGLSGPGDLTDVDADITPLDDRGGPTQTRAPALSSPAIDAIPFGTAGLCDASTPTDQRGVARPAGVACDIGAVEGGIAAAPLVFAVDVAGDEPDGLIGDGVCDTGAGCTLRAAIDELNAAPLGGTATIAAGLDPIVLDEPGTDLGGSDLDILGPVTIEGNGATLQGTVGSRVLHHHGGELIVRDVTITGGQVNALLGGAGMMTTGRAVLEGVNVIGNIADKSDLGSGDGYGAGILVDRGASLIVRDSLIADNGWIERSGNPYQAGSGIYAAAGGTRLEVDRSTIRDNGTESMNVDEQVSTRDWALISNSTISGLTQSGLSAYGTTRVVNSTITGPNSAITVGRGNTVDIVASTLHATGRTLAFPTTGVVPVIRVQGSILSTDFSTCPGPVTSLGYNFDEGVGCGFTSTGDRQLYDVKLGPLADNGGPTPTRLPLSTSISINRIPVGTAGLCDGTLPTDQRGIARPVGTRCDVGAAEQ
jgi:CSLREA domain-containing protein